MRYPRVRVRVGVGVGVRVRVRVRVTGSVLAPVRLVAHDDAVWVLCPHHLEVAEQRLVRDQQQPRLTLVVEALEQRGDLVLVRVRVRASVKVRVRVRVWVWARVRVRVNPKP